MQIKKMTKKLEYKGRTMHLCKLYSKAEGKRPVVQCQPLLVEYKQQANPLLSMHNYTPLVITR
jgi:hypothetical protein